MKTGIDAAGLGHNPILTDIIAEAALTPTQAIPGHTTGTADTSTEAPHDAHTPMPITLTMTLQIEDYLPMGALQVTLEAAADHNLDQQSNQLRKPCINLHPIPADHKENCITEEIPESQ